ncbi:MAG TPA: hypothetical protein VLF60_05495 [Candidatus Saccharimonadales bacterium]|nr:hypothetical protein [Candidatus Saccharimonadales bacterium]
MFRYRKNEKVARTAHRPTKCPFCHLEDKVLNPRERQIIEETAHARVMDALYPYDLWEWRQVTSHLLIVPKRHIALLDELTPEERSDIMDLMCKYDTQNYSVYARSPRSIQRTIPGHQHTHLIKTNETAIKKGAIYMVKPYLLRKF